jgi:hypothetical protein
VEAYQNLERAKAWQETHTTKYPD